MSWDLKEPLCLSQARLMVASPEFVYDQLKFFGENTDRWLGGKGKSLKSSCLNVTKS